MQSHIGCICLAFFSTVHFHVFPQMACLKGCKVTLVTFVWLLPTVRFHVFLQNACLRGCKVTLVAFVWHFSTVLFHVSPQIACLRGCKVTLAAFFDLSPLCLTLVAFVCLVCLFFSTVCFQMGPQLVHPRGCKVTVMMFHRHCALPKWLLQTKSNYDWHLVSNNHIFFLQKCKTQISWWRSCI